ncbi:MAG: RHS repeat domain-containing protein [Candidatus Binatia bacterium]
MSPGTLYVLTACRTVKHDRATTISRFAYTYDAVGNRITRTTTNGIANYTYDALNRLTQAVQPDPVDPLQQITESFTYDPVGNRTASHLATGQVHDAANRLTEDSDFTYTYDGNGNGNLTAKTSKATGERTVYTYNVENQLIRVEKFTLAGGASPVTTAAYRYDALGRRIEKNVNGVITRYIYDNEDILVELDGTNAVIVRYTHGPGIDEPLVMLRGGQNFFYHADGLNSISDLTDGAGTVVRSYTYDSFGQFLAQTGTVTNPYTYTGRELDDETGLYHYRARTLDSSTGRFLTVDPIIDPGILSLNPVIFSIRQLPSVSPLKHNVYTYVAMNPVTFVDPFGLASCRAFPQTCPGGIWSGAGFETGIQLGVFGIRRSGVTLRCWGNPDLTASLDITCDVIGGGLSADFSGVGVYCFGGQTKAQLSGFSEGFAGGGGSAFFGSGAGLTGSKTGATCISTSAGIGAGAFGGAIACETTVQ